MHMRALFVPLLVCALGLGSCTHSIEGVAHGIREEIAVALLPGSTGAQVEQFVGRHQWEYTEWSEGLRTLKVEIVQPGTKEVIILFYFDAGDRLLRTQVYTMYL